MSIVVAAVLGVVAAAVLVGLVLFLRAVFGGGGFGRTPRAGHHELRSGPPGPRPDSHPGATRAPGEVSTGQWGGGVQ